MARRELRIKATYSPEGLTPKVWELDLLHDVSNSEYIAMQRVSGLPGIQALFDGIDAGDMIARTALLWLLLKREMSTLSWSGLTFSWDEFEVELVETDQSMLAKLRDLKDQDALNERGAEKLAELEARLGASVEDPKA